MVRSLPIDPVAPRVRWRELLPTLFGVGSLLLGGMALAQDAPVPSVALLIGAGKIAEARAAFEAQAPSAVDRLFFEGRVAKSQRRFDEAIRLFRRTLELDPNRTDARRELAHTLMLNRDYGAAKYHFNALLQSDPNPRMRAGYQQFITRIDREKPVGISGHFSILPSNNVNRGTNNLVFNSTLGTFVIDPNSRAESGIGVQLGASGFFRNQIGPAARLALNWSVTGTRYEEGRYNSLFGNVAASYEQITSSGVWKVSPYTRVNWRADDADNYAYGASLSYAHRFSTDNQLKTTFAHEYRGFPVQSYQDGTYTSASVQLSHQFTPSFSISGGVGLDRSRPEADHLKYDGYRVFGNFSKIWEGGYNTTFGAEVGARNFVGDFPLMGAARDDNYLKLNMGVQNSKINVNGFTPRLNCSYTVNQSNVAFYDYTATECQAVLSRKF